MVIKPFDQIENERNSFRKSFLQLKQAINKNVIIQKINQWEEYSIEVIKKTAKTSRDVLIEYTNKLINEIEIK